ncbi:nucleotide pyrophosphohydrolase [Paenibacillus apiarius]|uniref:Nucleotide pyrophosphohydrolase n=1 Tax=Paenibacillus apiarius TaxID=46240 RepID=A0ABT4DSD2_9BACL|nr:nucleotide pyrophosphohydrolase [Paenibacillus apiarius]MCY9517074.1 nucleotide pyrophosphohydrolase [Paenibacillus apiarius]MCY9520229.1 nucleotide pyrophosphohydrolase [Paenibacillus apiarius]MCY9554883.1 nucleotide pyrophosphohydrolase [Paenibacillus apiarius]MCY9561394.1 nucleotide pyrophosphohydrolase [Paenibacillus apiarius]MCY9685916.1 nucleotide pyrophosphohydrolase [Paenibacillus apiarius]
MTNTDVKSLLSSLRDKPISQMQREVDEYISQFQEGYFSPLAMLARLSEEVGELAREVNHYYGEKPKKSSEADNSIDMELGDILFILLCFSNSLGIDLTKAYDACMHKFNTRDANRWTRIEKETQE